MPLLQEELQDREKQLTFREANLVLLEEELRKTKEGVEMEARNQACAQAEISAAKYREIHLVQVL